MAKIMTMPKIGVNMTEAFINRWIVNEGDTIKEGDHIIDAETDKAVQEIYSTMSGVIGKIIAQVGETVEILKPIALILNEGEIITDAEIAVLLKETIPREVLLKETIRSEVLLGETIPTTAPLKEAISGVAVGIITKHDNSKLTAFSVSKEVPQIIGNEKIKISPLAKKIAKDMGIDYKMIYPSQIGARICKEDVLQYSKNKAENTISMKMNSVVGGISAKIPMTGTRKVIAERMSASNQTMPKVPLVLSVNVEELIKWRMNLKKNAVIVSFNDLLVKICAKALEEFPIMNSRIYGDNIEIIGDINIGVAVDTEKGLVVPVIKNANTKGVISISTEFNEKINRIKEGRSNADDITGGTFTITNLGMFEVEEFTPIINPPECCILGVGAIIKKPIVADDGISVVIKSMLKLTLCFDHRIVDGAPAAKFLQRIKHLTEAPIEMLN